MRHPSPKTVQLLIAAGLSIHAAYAQSPARGPQPRPNPPRPPADTRPAPDRHHSPVISQTRFGDPLSGLTAAQLAAFAAGREEFENVETPEGGLGPIFNNVSCVSCHAAGATGGGSAITVTRFGKLTNGVFDPMNEQGGSLLQSSAIDPAVQEVVPADANVIAHRQSTPLFGIGLIEAISDADILRNAARPAVDGISGRAAQIVDAATGQTRVGRFGWKAQQASLLTFAGDAYLNEMGITSRLFPTENAPNGNTALLAQYDAYADPEDTVDATGRGDIDAAADFMRLLAPPPVVLATQSANAGRTVFFQLGCANCHTPSMNTGPNAIAALSMKNVPLYSDLLLHDMGSLGDGIAQSAAGMYEMRTAPLWGLRVSGPYLHDGRAATVDAAIRAHDGEGKNARVRYENLPRAPRQQLLDFLNTI